MQIPPDAGHLTGLLGPEPSTVFDRIIDVGLLLPACYDIGQLKPGLYIALTIPEHASDVAPKRILRLLIHRFQIFLEKYECYCM